MRDKDQQEQDDRHSLRHHHIPEYMADPIIGYVLYGQPPENFLDAVLCNDLAGAVRYADYTNLPLIANYVRWFYNEAPSGCWGSREKVEAWMAARQAERKKGYAMSYERHEVTGGKLEFCQQ